MKTPHPLVDDLELLYGHLEQNAVGKLVLSVENHPAGGINCAVCLLRARPKAVKLNIPVRILACRVSRSKGNNRIIVGVVSMRRVT